MRKHQQPTTQEPVKTKKKNKFSVISGARTGLQILFFIWMPSLYILAFSGLVELVSTIFSGTFSFSEIWPDLIPLAAVLPFTILAGRFFCGWMCAFGSLTDWVFRIFSRWTRRRSKLSHKADRLLKSVKYVVLAALLLLGIFSSTLSLSSMSPWDVFGMLFTVGAAPAILFVLQSLLPGFLLLLLILVASAFVERFFCRYLCPIGALYALTSGGKMVRIDKPRDKCGSCQICTRSCAMGIPLNQMDQVKSGECIGCMKCVEACPRKNVKVHVGKSPVYSAAIAVTIVALMTGTYLFQTVLAEAANTSLAAYTSTGAALPAENAGNEASAVSGGTSDTAAASDQQTTTGGASEAAAIAAETTVAATTEATTAATTAGLYADGTYEGSGTGFRGGTTTVEVTIENGQITNIAVVSYQDDRPYFEKAFPTITADVISSQSTDVDIVSRATFSSNGIIEAISNALSSAKN